MNLIEFIKVFPDSDVIFRLIPRYEQAGKEIFYTKGKSIYKTTIEILDFSNTGNFVWAIWDVNKKSIYDFDKMIIDEKRTVKAIFAYSHLLYYKEK